MLAARVVAIVWLLGAIYILIKTWFAPGIFGGVTVLFGIPAGIGILAGRRWAIVPSLLLSAAWSLIAIILMVSGGGVNGNSVSLLVAGVLSGVVVVLGYRRRPGASSFELR